MKRALLTAAALLCSAQAYALPIGLSSRHCVCQVQPQLVDVTLVSGPELSDEGQAELQRLDDLHEPPAGTIPDVKHILVCLDEPTMRPFDRPETPVPEPELLGLLAMAFVAVGVRRRR